MGPNPSRVFLVSWSTAHRQNMGSNGVRQLDMLPRMSSESTPNSGQIDQRIKT